MASGFYKVPKAVNEPINSYAPGTPQREALLATYRKMYGEQVDIPFYIGSEAFRTGNTVDIHPPHDHKTCSRDKHASNIEFSPRFWNPSP